MLKKIGTVCTLLTLATVLIAVGCGKGSKNKNESADGAAKPQYASKGDEGTITGKVSYDGAVPELKKIDMNQDANCVSAAGDKTADDLLVADGKLANVFVYLKGGPTDKFSFPTPSDPVVLDQQGCRYHPRVLGLQTNQPFKVINSDNTTHNIHPSPKVNAEDRKSTRLNSSHPSISYAVF